MFWEDEFMKLFMKMAEDTEKKLFTNMFNKVNIENKFKNCFIFN